jgi:hypothetical protein
VLYAATGELRKSFSARFTRMAALDVADLSLIADGQRLLISSTRRVWVIDAGLEPLERVDTIGPLAGAPDVVGNRVIIAEHDLEDPAEGVLREEFALPLDSWFCFAVELVGCSFSGQLHKAVFNGRLPTEKRDVAGRSTNQFEGNDFSRAKLLDVAFRTGIDLSNQRLPSGPEYSYLEDAPSAVRQARSAFNALAEPEEKKRVRGALAVMEEDVAAGQGQLLIRVNDYPRASRPSIRRLLHATSACSAASWSSPA